MITKPDHKKFVFTFLGLTTTAVMSVLLILFLAYKTGNLAAPPVTGSLSFDEKLYYTAGMKGVKDIDVLAVGSSMTFNNLSSAPIADRISKKFINFSSWGLTIEQTAYFIKFLVPLYKPKIVIIVSSPMDFYYSKRSPALFDKNEVRRYLMGHDVIQSYGKHFDPIYLLKLSKDIKELRSSNSRYESLLFDAYGGVLLDINKANIDRERWETRIDPARLDPEAYRALENLGLFLKQQKITFVMVQPPMRHAAVDGLSGQLANHWQKVKDISSNTSFIFVNMHERLNLSDDFFVDYAHLNYKGADIFTRGFLDAVSPTLLTGRYR